MDKREVLPGGTRLRFLGMECVVEKDLGRGSSVLVYTGYYHDSQDPRILHRVLIRELFPYDPQGGIFRSEGGDLVIEKKSEELYREYREKFLRANGIHSRMAEEIPEDLDIHINTFTCRSTLYGVMGYSGGRSLREEILRMSAEGHYDMQSSVPFENRESAAGQTGESARRPELLLRAVHIVRGALQVLSSFHETDYLHLDISPDNILLIGKNERERATLIDFNSVYTREEAAGNPSIVLSMKEGYTAPEVRTGRFSFVGPHTDLFSMTAVFWNIISGRRLYELEQIGAALPDPESLPRCRGLSGPVLSMLRRILRKGLSPSPGKRYRNAESMLADLKELEDRILGLGITRWALWENGRGRISGLMRENVSLRFVQDEGRIYPLSVETEDGTRWDLLELAGGCNAPGDQRAPASAAPDLPGPKALDAPALPAPDTPGQKDKKAPGEAAVNAPDPEKPLLILGGGGMGKTTALMYLAWAAYCKDREYRESAPAVFYISLYGYRDGGDHFLRNTLLEGMRFKPGTDSMEGARRELMELLDKKGGPKCGPVLYLLLDGFNEASGNTGPLLDEIILLSQKEGVRILMTSRSDPGGLLFTKLSLCRLEPAMIREKLSREGILPPENPEVFDLLGFPILLSMYIQAVGGQGTSPGRLQSREELLDAYFSVLRQKESKAAGLDAVFSYLLPEIAARIHDRGCAMTDAELIGTAEKCYKELCGRAITAVFPQWIGRTAELRLETKNADEWYGLAVLDILHRRTGILIKDEKGSYRLLHQLMEEHLTEKSRQFHRGFDGIKRRQKTLRGIAAAVLLFLLTALFGLYNYRIRRQMEQKNRQIVTAETEMGIMDAVRNSEDALDSGDRDEAVESALDAVLLSLADYSQAETVLIEEDGLSVLREDIPVLRERVTGGSVLVQDSYYLSKAQKALTDALGVYDPAVFKTEIGENENRTEDPSEDEKENSELQAGEADGVGNSAGSGGFAAADGGDLSQDKKAEEIREDSEDYSSGKEFFTKKHRLLADQGRIIIYDRETGKNLGEMEENARVENITQTGEYIVIQYLDPEEGTRFGYLMNEYFETLAYLPGLCGVEQGQLLFESPDKSIRRTPVYTLLELIDLAM